MIYTVTFNPALDYVMNLKELQYKDINRTESEQLYYGGKGINVSAILSRLGVDNIALGFLAGFSGRQIEEMLNAESINNDFVYLKKGYTRINVKIKADEDYDINAQGPDIEAHEINALFDKLEKLQSGDFLVLAGSIPNSLPNDIYEEILAKLQNKGINFGVEVKSEYEIAHYARNLQEMGARNVLVSRSKDGATLIDENGEVHSMGNVPGKVINPVGCGDSMVAGFVAGYTKTHDYKYALKLGSACGNATAFCSGLADKATIDLMLKSEYLK